MFLAMAMRAASADFCEPSMCSAKRGEWGLSPSVGAFPTPLVCNVSHQWRTQNAEDLLLPRNGWSGAACVWFGVWGREVVWVGEGERPHPNCEMRATALGDKGSESPSISSLCSCCAMCEPSLGSTSNSCSHLDDALVECGSGGRVWAGTIF